MDFKEIEEAKAFASLCWDVKRIFESFPQYIDVKFTPEKALLLLLQQAATEVSDLADHPP
jgi:hypothetical protein